MIYNYLKAAIRHFLRHRFFSFLNITGLAVGFACCLMLALFVWQEVTYDNFHDKGDRIARVIMEYKVGDRSASVAMTGSKVAPTFVRELPEVVAATRFYKYPVVVTHEEEQYEENSFIWADSTLFDLFDFQLLEGNPRTALAAPRRVVITREMAEKYFGTKDPVGEMLTINNKTEYEITGIIQSPPQNSQIKFDFIGSFASLPAATNEQWFSANYFTYILVRQPQAIQTLNDKLFEYMKTKEDETELSGENYLTYHLEPLQEVHLTSSIPGLEPAMDRRYVIIFGIVTILILVIACTNYMNLATARAADRGTEVGVRKVMGAQRSELFWQFITESVLSVLLAAGLGWVIASLLMPYFNDTLGKQYSLDILVGLLPLSVILLIVFLVAFGAGIYPALVLTHFSPVKTLKGNFRTSRAGLGLRRTLIVFQFVISAGLIICSLVIYQQITFIQTTNLGYTKDHMLVQSVDNEIVDRFETIKGRLGQIPQVDKMTLVHETPTYINWGDGIETNDGKTMMVTANPVQADYLKTFDIKLLAGQDFSYQDQVQANSDSAYQLNQKGRNILINNKAAQELGYASPEAAIGERVNFKGNATIRGVFDDFHFAPLHQEVGPLILFVDKMYNQLVIRINGDDLENTLSLIEREWTAIAPHLPFEPRFLDDEYNAMYENEENLARLFMFFTVIAVILGSLGLLGLSALMISHRTKEIGIRKVMGASVSQVVGVLSYDFLKLVMIAFLISIPLAWYVMDTWLQTFVYRIDMPWLLFAGAGGMLIFLALATLSTQTVRAATRNPTEVIRE